MKEEKEQNQEKEIVYFLDQPKSRWEKKIKYSDEEFCNNLARNTRVWFFEYSWIGLKKSKIVGNMISVEQIEYELRVVIEVKFASNKVYEDKKIALIHKNVGWVIEKKNIKNDLELVEANKAS